MMGVTLRSGGRRQALLAIVLSLLLGGCGIEQAQPERVRTPVCAAGQIDGEVVILSPPDQISPEVINGFEERYAVEVVERFYDNDDDLLSRVTAGADDFDILVAADYLAETLQRGGRLFPLDPIALPGRVNLDPKFDHQPDRDDGFHSVPFLWGTVGIGLNLNVVGEDTDPTWALVFDTERAWIYAGRVSMLGEGRQVLAAAMLYLGHSPNLADRDRVREAADVAAAAMAHLRGFDSEAYGARLAEGVLDVAHGRSDVFIEALPAESTDFRYIIPREGAVAWVDVLAVPTTALHPCSAHSFIDFVLEPRNGAAVANYAGVATPNLAALEFVSPELASNPHVYPPPDVSDRITVLRYSEDLNRLYAEEFVIVES